MSKYVLHRAISLIRRPLRRRAASDLARLAIDVLDSAPDGAALVKRGRAAGPFPLTPEKDYARFAPMPAADADSIGPRERKGQVEPKSGGRRRAARNDASARIGEIATAADRKFAARDFA